MDELKEKNCRCWIVLGRSFGDVESREGRKKLRYVAKDVLYTMEKVFGEEVQRREEGCVVTVLEEAQENPEF